MYDLPFDLDLSKLTGANLDQISFGVGSISFDFGLKQHKSTGKSETAKIVALGSVLFLLAGEEIDIRVGNYSEIARLGVLLNLDVVDALARSKRSVKVDFGAGRQIVFNEDGDGLESYHIYMPGTDMVYV